MKNETTEAKAKPRCPARRRKSGKLTTEPEILQPLADGMMSLTARDAIFFILAIHGYIRWSRDAKNEKNKARHCSTRE